MIDLTCFKSTWLVICVLLHRTGQSVVIFVTVPRVPNAWSACLRPSPRKVCSCAHSFRVIFFSFFTSHLTLPAAVQAQLLENTSQAVIGMATKCNYFFLTINAGGKSLMDYRFLPSWVAWPWPIIKETLSSSCLSLVPSIRTGPGRGWRLRGVLRTEREMVCKWVGDPVTEKTTEFFKPLLRIRQQDSTRPANR